MRIGKPEAVFAFCFWIGQTLDAVLDCSMQQSQAVFFVVFSQLIDLHLERFHGQWSSPFLAEGDPRSEYIAELVGRPDRELQVSQ